MKNRCLRVCVPVADLRKRPVDRSYLDERDALQETQVLCNEVLNLVDTRDKWCFVEASEQIRIDASGTTRGYPGWIRKSAVVEVGSEPVYNAVVKKVRTTVRAEPSHEGAILEKLPLGVRLTVEENGDTPDWTRMQLSKDVRAWICTDHIRTLSDIRSEEQVRENLVNTAELFIGMPYLWGGRSTCVTEDAERTGGAVCGVDCSGLTNLVYRANLIDVPRDAADQARVCAHITFDMLKRADLVFVSAEGVPGQIVHVMLSLGGEEFIEAAETGSFVRCCTFEEKYGFTTSELRVQHWNVSGREISFGSVLR